MKAGRLVPAFFPRDVDAPGQFPSWAQGTLGKKDTTDPTYRYQDDLFNSNTHLNFDITLNSTEFDAEALVVTGGGMGSFTGEHTQHDEPTYLNQFFTLTMNQTIPVIGGCPTGSFAMDSDSSSFSIGFDGHPTAHWDYVPGPGQLQEGTLTFNCSK